MLRNAPTAKARAAAKKNTKEVKKEMTKKINGKGIVNNRGAMIGDQNKALAFLRSFAVSLFEVSPVIREQNITCHSKIRQSRKPLPILIEDNAVISSETIERFNNYAL